MVIAQASVGAQQCAATAFNGQGTGGHGRAFAQEDSNLTARRLFLPEKYP
jgi:hypothetical protein